MQQKAKCGTLVSTKHYQKGGQMMNKSLTYIMVTDYASLETVDEFVRFKPIGYGYSIELSVHALNKLMLYGLKTGFIDPLVFLDGIPAFEVLRIFRRHLQREKYAKNKEKLTKT